jgi:hypothetical protein
VSSSANYAPSSRLLWSLVNCGAGTTLTEDGDSGGWQAAAQNIKSAVDLRDITDVWLAVYVAGTSAGTNPTLQVQLDVFDDQGNLFPQVLKLSTPFSSSPNLESTSGGLHTTGLVLPSWGRVSWTVGGTNPVFPEANIALFGR